MNMQYSYAMLSMDVGLLARILNAAVLVYAVACLSILVMALGVRPLAYLESPIVGL